VLSGSDDRFFVDRVQQLFAGRGVKGGAVRLTLDPAAQKAAYDGLAGRTGAVVAIDPRTGAILALVASPSFDPNVLSSHNPAQIRKAYDAYTNDPAQPLLNRPLVMALPPGSTFKLVTAAAALESGKYTPTTVVPGPASLPLPNSTRELKNWSGSACGPTASPPWRTRSRSRATRRSPRSASSSAADALRAQAEKFGFTGFEVPLRCPAHEPLPRPRRSPQR
jgi:peptidoglycan glycosyltransferase